MTFLVRRRLAVVGLVVAILIGAYSILGFIMAVTFTESGVAAIVYTILFSISVVTAVLTARFIRRSRDERSQAAT